jgi:integrase
MAEVSQRAWKIPGQRTKRKAWGFTVQLTGGKRIRNYRAEWSKEDAERALAAVQLQIEPARPQGAGITFGEAVERYLAAKVEKKTLDEDKRQLGHLTAAFGAETPLAEITAAAISAYRDGRLGKVSESTGRPLGAASINRPLQLLRHLLRLARYEWEALTVVPVIKLKREPQGRIRWLEPHEEARLLDACRRSLNPELAAIVIVAMETGLRQGELLGLTWERLDMTRGVIRLEITKSGKRREVKMRQVVYNTLAALPGTHEGHVWRQGSIRKAFINAVQKAGLDDFHFHDLRHHFASWYMMRGGTLLALSKILGHATVKMTERYAHLSSEHLHDEMDRTASPMAQGSAQEPLRELAPLGNIA